jgi:hypothetical protein
MVLSYVAYALSIVIGAGVILVGARFLLAPRSAAIGYGVPVDVAGLGDGVAYLTIKGVRDGMLGVLVFVALFAGGRHVLAWYLLTAAVIPFGDVLIVLRRGGSRATAYGIHGATAVLMVITALLLLIA